MSLRVEIDPLRVPFHMRQQERVHHPEPERRHQGDKEHPKIPIRQGRHPVEMPERLIPATGVRMVVGVSL